MSQVHCQLSVVQGKAPHRAKRVFVAVFVAVALAACGGGGSSPTPPAPTGPDLLLVIGNSITASGLNPMWPDWAGPIRGMAASAPEKDFAHVAATALGLPLAISGGVDIETRPETVTGTDYAAKVAAASSRSYVVIELGDNALVANLSAFAPAYDKLLAQAKVAAKLVCLSTWWGNTPTDDVIKASCAKAGGKYVYIGDLWKDPANRDLLEGPQYENPGVQAHPHDWSMSIIGKRVAEALK